MTDNEIVKALEQCINDDLDCDGCPLYSKCRNEDYATENAALDLLKSQKAEIQESNLKINHQAEIIRIYERALEDKAAEINGLINAQETLQKCIAEKDAEIESLQFQYNH